MDSDSEKINRHVVLKYFRLIDEKDIVQSSLFTELLVLELSSLTLYVNSVYTAMHCIIIRGSRSTYYHEFRSVRKKVDNKAVDIL
jgi:hypothetical protein